MMIRGAMVYGDGGFTRRDIYIEGDRFADAAGGQVLDGSGCYAIPGLIDIHTHGCVRHDYTTADSAGIRAMAEYEAQNGVTALCATTMTLPEAELAAACRRLAETETPDGAEIVGIHLEGPFVSPKKLGAQNPAHATSPDEALVRRLMDAGGDKVRILSLAPELPGALDVIGGLSGELICSLAHTAADYDTALRAMGRGARHITHIYNAMTPFTHREPGVIGAALDTPGACAELIADGVHIHPSAVRATLSMFGADRIIFISDSMMATGLDDGTYDLGGLAVEVRGNVARLREGGAIAGSVTNLMDCLRQAVLQMGVPLETAVQCASVSPARALGEDSRGGIAPGKLADLVLLEPDLSIRQVILRGRPIR